MVMPPRAVMSRTDTINAIMALCNYMPKPLAHRRYLEGLKDRELEQRLQDLAESEQNHQRRRNGWHRQMNLVPT